MSIPNTRNRRRPLRAANFDPCNNEKREYKEPAVWTIITALDCILGQARNSQLSDEFWETCKNPLDFLQTELGLSKMQIVVLAILIEAGEPLSWRQLAQYLDCSRLSIMVYSEEIEELVDKRWVMRKGTRELGGWFEGFALVHGVITALRHNKVFVPERIDGFDEQGFVDKLESHICKNFDDRSVHFCDDEKWMLQLVAANPHLPLCQEVLSLNNDIHVQSLLLMIVFDYAQYADSEQEGMNFSTIDRLYPEESECGFLRRRLRDGSHILIQRGYIEHKCDDGIADAECYRLTSYTKEHLLSAYTPSRAQCHTPSSKHRALKSFGSIKQKALFFNASEQEQIDRLAELLSVDNLHSVQQRLEEEGMRKGFACLFYGAPGTGKTETVLQIARQTGRDIMQVDIAGMRDKWVGESEKNIKGVFTHYRKLCKTAKVMPILFFNEADALINKRTENVTHSVEKMDNAMQNIILQEIEDLDGILIATTNLTSNLDNAFERRFLFKIEFHKPNTDIKTMIWSSMLKDLSAEDAHQLASKYDFSGGQIENIARKRTINYILSGKKPTLEELETYCQNELLENKKEYKAIVGFSMKEG